MNSQAHSNPDNKYDDISLNTEDDVIVFQKNTLDSFPLIILELWKYVKECA